MSPKDRARTFVEVANGALMEGDPTGALENLLLAEREYDKLPEIYHGKALVFHFKNNSAEALQNAQKAVRMKPDYSDANNTYGKLLLDANRGDEAIPYLTRAANDPLYREIFKPLTNLGLLYYKRGEYTSAKDYFDRAIKAAPVVACVAYYYRGSIQNKLSRVNEAIKDFEKATQKVCANYADAHLALGVAYVHTKDYTKARKKFLEVQQVFPDSPQAEQAISQMRYLP